MNWKSNPASSRYVTLESDLILNQITYKALNTATIIVAAVFFVLHFFRIPKDLSNALKMIVLVTAKYLLADFISLIRLAKFPVTSIWDTTANRTFFFFFGKKFSGRMFPLALLSILNVFQLNFKASSP